VTKMWQPYQQRRLAQERVALQRHMPSFQFFNPTQDTYISGWWASNTNQQYQITSYLPDVYPEAMPDTYVTFPSPLPAYRGLIESYGTSHDMHTYATDQPGWVKVCIVRPEDWSAAYTMLKVLRKAQLWLTAYECHLDDGQPIKNFLK
jgi:hypothetical protein